MIFLSGKMDRIGRRIIKRQERNRVLSVSCNGDTYGIRTHEPGVRGRCLNRLTKVPMVTPMGFEPMNPA